MIRFRRNLRYSENNDPSRQLFMWRRNLINSVTTAALAQYHKDVTILIASRFNRQAAAIIFTESFLRGSLVVFDIYHISLFYFPSPPSPYRRANNVTLLVTVNRPEGTLSRAYTHVRTRARARLCVRCSLRNGDQFAKALRLAQLRKARGNRRSALLTGVYSQRETRGKLDRASRNLRAEAPVGAC